MAERGDDKIMPDRRPLQMGGKKGGDDVGDEGESEGQEDALDQATIATHHDHPDQDGGADDRHRQRHSEQTEPAGHPRKLRKGCTAVGDEHHHRRKQRPAHPETLTDQVHEALACDSAEAGDHLLRDDQCDHNRQEDPQQAVPVLGARVAVREDAAGVVTRVGDDDPGTDDREISPQARQSAGPRATALTPLGDGLGSSAAQRRLRGDRLHVRSACASQCPRPAANACRHDLVHGVVDGDDALHPVLVVDDRNRK